MKRRWHFYIVGGLLLVGLILGSFFDLQINQAIFSKNNGFGLTISAFGMIPGYGTLAFLGGALFALTFKNEKFNKWIRILFYVITIALYGLATFFLGRDVFSDNGFNIPSLDPWLGCIIMGVLMIPVTYFGYWCGKKNENPHMWIIILVLAGAMFMALVPGTTLLKAIMHRPRYRIAIHEGYADYHNWWQPCKNYLEIINSHPGVLTKEEFKSFPSGHSTAVMCGLIMFTIAPLMNKKWMKYQVPMFYIAFAWSLLVMFCRMLVGAHFLSDTCMGALLAVIFFYIANEIIVAKLLPMEEKETAEAVEDEK